MQDIFGTASQHGHDNLAGWLFLAVIIILALWQVPYLIRSFRSIPADKAANLGDDADTESASLERPKGAARSVSERHGTEPREKRHESASFVTIASFNTAVEAHILQGRLEDEGIASNIVDAETVTMAWHLGQAVGGIKVQVFADDAERACEIIEKKTVLQEITPDAEEEGDVLRKVVRRALLASFFGLAIPPLQLYSLWLVGRLFSSHFGPIRGVRGRIILALVLNIYFFVFVFFGFRMIATLLA
jgi:hypothetical protein